MLADGRVGGQLERLKKAGHRLSQIQVPDLQRVLLVQNQQPD